MKSLLHEGSSIIKAVEAAWASAGMPQEFSIKVLEAGEKNFFGMTKRPAVVSIMYDPTRDAKKNNQNRQNQQRSEVKEKITRMDLDAARQQRDNNQERQERPRPERTNKPERQERQARPERQERSQQQQRAERPERPVQQNAQKQQRPQQEAPHAVEKPTAVVAKQAERPVSSEQSGVQEPAAWSHEMAQEMMTLLVDILKIMQSDVIAQHEIQGQQLVIKLSSPVLADKEQERNLYSSLAFLMLQIIKKTYKKRFKGYRVLFEAQQQPASN